MRARHRHFNPRFAGADLVLDARYINQSDNTAVSTWADRSGNAYDASQANATNQPTFQTAEQGGNGGVDFDGSNDWLEGSYNPITVPRTVHVVFKSDVSEVNTLFQVPKKGANSAWIARWGTENNNFFISGDTTATNQSISTPSNTTSGTVGSWSSDSSRNVSFALNGTTQTVSGNPPNAATSQVNGYYLGRLFNFNGLEFGQLWDGLIFSVHVWGDEQIAAPLRKRCEHASAFSFKIACS